MLKWCVSNRMEDAATQRLDWDQTITQLELMTFILLEECKNSHTPTTTTTGSNYSRKEVNNQTNNQNSILCPQKLPLFQFLVLFEVKGKTHTQQQDQLITIS